MGIIRGKIEADRELHPRFIIHGESKFRRCFCGCDRWYDPETGQELECVTFEEAFKEMKSCRIENPLTTKPENEGGANEAE